MEAVTMMKTTPPENNSETLVKSTLRWANVAYMISARLTSQSKTVNNLNEIGMIARKLSYLIGYGDQILGATTLEYARQLCLKCQHILVSSQAEELLSQPELNTAKASLADLMDAILEEQTERNVAFQ